MFRVYRILSGRWDKKSEIAIMLQMSQAPPRYQTLYLLSSIGYLFSIGEKSTPTFFFFGGGAYFQRIYISSRAEKIYVQRWGHLGSLIFNLI
jgi:hypothetical protein